MKAVSFSGFNCKSVLLFIINSPQLHFDKIFHLQKLKNLTVKFLSMGGSRKDFFQGGVRGFFRNFSRGRKSGETCFFPLESKKTTFFAKIFKI